MERLRCGEAVNRRKTLFSFWKTAGLWVTCDGGYLDHFECLGETEQLLTVFHYMKSCLFCCLSGIKLKKKEPSWNLLPQDDGKTRKYGNAWRTLWGFDQLGLKETIVHWQLLTCEGPRFYVARSCCNSPRWLLLIFANIIRNFLEYIMLAPPKVRFWVKCILCYLSVAKQLKEYVWPLEGFEFWVISHLNIFWRHGP